MARQGNASDQQLAILERWKEERDTSYIDVEQAIYAYGECLTDGGVEYRYTPPAAGDDYPEVRVAVYAGDSGSESFDMMNYCNERELDYVDSAYQLGPGVTARRARNEADYLPTAIACLEEHHITFDEVESLEHLDLLMAEQQIQDPWGCTIPPYSRFDG